MDIQQKAKEAADYLIEFHNKQERLIIIRDFVARVNQLAEANIERTGKLEGAHYAAMTKLLKDLEGEVEAQRSYTYPEILKRYFPEFFEETENTPNGAEGEGDG